MIGVFDSGVGGLTVLKGFIKHLPDYDYIYLGDNANVPYGNKSSEIIYNNYSKKAIDFLYSQSCRLIIVACNSVSAQALKRIQDEYIPEKYPDLKVLGVIRPMAEELKNNPKIKKVAIIGTRATINSNVYIKELEKLDAKLEVFQKATPLLVPLIEENWIKKPETKMILKKYLRSLKMSKPDSMVLACTHYPFLMKQIQAVMGKSCKVLDTETIISESLKKYLENHPELNIKKSKNPKHQFYASDNLNLFIELGEKFLGQKMNNVKQVKL